MKDAFLCLQEAADQNVSEELMKIALQVRSVSDGGGVGGDGSDSGDDDRSDGGGDGVGDGVSDGM